MLFFSTDLLGQGDLGEVNETKGIVQAIIA
jgi:hypothetical protein